MKGSLTFPSSRIVGQPEVGPKPASRRSVGEERSATPHVPQADLIGIGAAVTRRPLPHHRAYGSVHGGSSWLR
jgi:hypothetical protein